MFIAATKRGMLPPAAIARVVAASFALGTSVPIRRSRTVMRWPARRESVDSPILVAAAGTVTVWSRSSRRIATSAVMSFVIEAIARGSSASRAASVLPSTELCTT